jgi:hypothetical protein
MIYLNIKTTMFHRKKRKTYCIVIPKQCGKTEITKKLEKYTSRLPEDQKYYFVDIDMAVQTLRPGIFEKCENNKNMRNQLLFPAIKDIIKESEAAGWGQMVILTSNPILYKFLKIKDKRLMCLMPSLDFVYNSDNKKVIGESRDEIYREFATKSNMFYCADYEEIFFKILTKFNLYLNA